MLDELGENIDDFNEEDIGEENESDLLDNQNESFSSAVVWTTDWTTETIVSQLNKGLFDINPLFQRRDAWSLQKKSLFIESLILGLPVPPIILAEAKQKKKYIVIDGKQRLLALLQFSDQKSSSNASLFDELKLTGLNVLKDLNKLSFQNLKESPTFEGYLSEFENQPIRAVIIKNWPNEEYLYRIFLRINTGSTSLNAQELRQALHPGPFTQFIDEFSVGHPEIAGLFGRKKPDKRMRDVELIVRYFAFKYYLNDYDSRFKALLDLTCESLNRDWKIKETQIKQDAEDLIKAIEFAQSIFDGSSVPFSKWSENRFHKVLNRAVFDIFTYYFSSKQIRNSAEPHKKEIKNKFVELCENDPKFIRALEFSVKDKTQIKYRFEKWKESLTDILSASIVFSHPLEP